MKNYNDISIISSPIYNTTTNSIISLNLSFDEHHHFNDIDKNYTDNKIDLRLYMNANVQQNNYSNHRKKPIYKPHNKWSKEEDNHLRILVEEFGENDWRHLAKKMEGRNSRQCRERWQYYLNPKLKQGEWTIEEDELIITKRNELGPKWMTISKYFDNRTDAMIKNRYNLLIRKEKRSREKNKSQNIKDEFDNNFNSEIPIYEKFSINETDNMLFNTIISDNENDYSIENYENEY